LEETYQSGESRRLDRCRIYYHESRRRNLSTRSSSSVSQCSCARPIQRIKSACPFNDLTDLNLVLRLSKDDMLFAITKMHARLPNRYQLVRLSRLRFALHHDKNCFIRPVSTIQHPSSYHGCRYKFRKSLHNKYIGSPPDTEVGNPTRARPRSLSVPAHHPRPLAPRQRTRQDPQSEFFLFLPS
jgi:hypothetical protein